MLLFSECLTVTGACMRGRPGSCIRLRLQVLTTAHGCSTLAAGMSIPQAQAQHARRPCQARPPACMPALARMLAEWVTDTRASTTDLMFLSTWGGQGRGAGHMQSTVHRLSRMMRAPLAADVENNTASCQLAQPTCHSTHTWHTPHPVAVAHNCSPSHTSHAAAPAIQRNADAAG